MSACSDAQEANSGLLNRSNIAFAVTFLAGGLAIGYLLGKRSILPRAAPRCNTKIHLEKEKIADEVQIEDIGQKKVFCRCWKSSKFPYCDGTHNSHNKETGDNVGPLIIKKGA